MLELIAAAGDPKQVQVDVQGLALLLGTIVPLVVALVNKSRANRALKSLSNVLLSALAAVIALWAKNDLNTDLWTSLNAFITALTASIASYYGVWKPTGVAPAIAGATGDVGIGSNDPASPASDTTYTEPTSTSTSTEGTPGTKNADDSLEDEPEAGSKVYKGDHYRPFEP